MISLHKNATTTPSIRQRMSGSDEPAAVLALRYGVNDLFQGDVTDDDQLIYVNKVILGKMLESETLDPAAIKTALSLAADCAESGGFPVLWRVGPSAECADLRARLEKAGLQPADPFPAMHMDLSNFPPPPKIEGLAIATATPTAPSRNRAIYPTTISVPVEPLSKRFRWKLARPSSGRFPTSAANAPSAAESAFRSSAKAAR